MFDPAEDLEGRTIAERYEIEARIGTGGMGAVYRARQLGLERPVALKVLKQHAAWDRDTVKRFHREAKTMSLLVHPNTVRIFDFGETEDGLLYLAMEMLEGRMLTEAILEEHLGVQDAVDIAAQVLLSLSEAHDKGIIHRDLKPDNIFLAEDPTSTEPVVKVLDFGIAKLMTTTSGVDSLETQAGTVFGTPKYMSPEQAQGHPLDSRCDLYAVGVLLYAMLTGGPPFDDDDAVVIMAKHIQDMPEPPRQRLPEAPIPKALDKVVMRALEKLPEDRFRDANEFLAALSDASPAVRAYATAGGMRRTLDRAARIAVPSGWIRAGVVGGALLLAVGFVGAALALRSRQRSDNLAAVAQADAAPAVQPAGAAPPPEIVVPETVDVSDAGGIVVRATLISTPAGAEVWEGEERLGTTPLEMELEAGSARNVDLRLAGYRPVEHLFAAIAAPQEVRLVRVRRSNRRADRSGRDASGMQGAPYERFD